MIKIENIDLPNVWAEDSENISEVTINRVICRKLCYKKGRFTGKEIKFTRTLCNLNRRDFGTIIGANEGTVSRWERSTIGMPTQSSEILMRIILLSALDETVTFDSIQRMSKLAADIEERDEQKIIIKAAKKLRNARTRQIYNLPISFVKTE